jgi:protein ImuB
MYWFAIHAPQLALEYALRGQAIPLPCALCDSHEVRQANQAALGAGIQPGMSRATALSLVTGLHIFEDCPETARAALHTLATALLAYTPAVSLHPPDGLLLEVSGSLRLFGGVTALRASIRQALVPRGLTARVASAPTAHGAWLLAQYQDGACISRRDQLPAGLAPLPIHLLRHAAPHCAGLAAMGIRDFGALTSLPRAGLSRRYGPALLDEIDAALGHSTEPRRWFEAPASFDQSLELFANSDQAEILLKATQPLFQALRTWLVARHQSTRQLTWQGIHESGRHTHPATTFHLLSSLAGQNIARWTGLLREHLARSTLAAAIHTLRLLCTDTEPVANTHGELFACSPCAPDALPQLLDRLQARWGREHIQRLGLADDHRPEHAYHVGPFNTPTHQPHSHPPELPRPLWLLDPPLALCERHHHPWWQGPLTLLHGPERIETGWWDGPWVERDYFIAENTEGVWVWIYRNRRPHAAGWFLHGLFG